MSKNDDVKATKNVDAEEVEKNNTGVPVFDEVDDGSFKAFWKKLPLKKKVGMILGLVGGAAAIGGAGYCVGKHSAVNTKADTSLELPETTDPSLIETEDVVADEVEV